MTTPRDSRRYLSRCVSATLLILVGVGAGAASAQPRDLTRGQDLLARADHNYHPYSFLDEQGQPAGFTVDLMRALAEVMGLEVEIRLGPWEEVRHDLANRQLDVVLGMYYSPERDRFADFSVPVTIATHAIFVRKDSPIRSVRDLRGRAILVQTDDIMHDYLREKGLTERVITRDEQTEVLRLLAAGHYDAALLGKLPGLYWANRYQLTNLKTVGGPLEARKFCFAVPEGDDVLLGVLNEGLNILKATGRFEEIQHTWFGVYEQESLMSDLLRKAMWVLVPLGFLLTLGFVWNWSLQRTVTSQTRELGRELAERRRVEQALRTSEDMARAVLNAASESIFLLDREGVVLDINEAAIRRLGVADSFVGKRLLDYFPPELAAARRHKVAKVFQTRQTVTFEDERGGYYFQTTVCPIFDENGEVSRIAVYAKDITESKRAEAERARLEAQVMHAQKLESLGVLAGGIAHDFNNLLMGILGNTDLVLDDLPAGAPVRESLHEIQTAANRAADICQQMLAYSGKGRFVIQSLDLSDLLGEMTQLLAVSVSKQAVLQYDCDPELPPVEGDATQIRQVIINLVTNASDALGESSGNIWIRTGVQHCTHSYLQTTDLGEDLPEGAYVYLEVADDGCGMDEQTRHRIFEPFYTTKFPGRGLGLAAVLGIIRGHQGTLTVQSAPGRGTIFRVMLPVTENPDEVYLAGRSSPVEISGRGTVLLIDDEDAVRALGARLLQRLGYKVITAADGSQGVERFRAHRHEIVAVLLDMTLPRMSGEETLRSLQNVAPDVRVLLSGGSKAVDLPAGLAGQGRVGLVRKPYQMAALGRKLQEILT